MLEEATFVYPIQEVTGAPDAFVAAGGDYLMSYPRLGSRPAAPRELHPFSRPDPDRPPA